jgi:hypothetical protein
MPPKYIYYVDSIHDTGILALSYKVSSDSTFHINSFFPAQFFPFSGFPLFRAHVVPHFNGFLCEGLEEELEIDTDCLSVDQCVNNKLTPLPLTKTTVKGTRSALTAQIASIPSWTKWPNNISKIIGKNKTWRWVWSSYRDRRVSDFLWRLLHKSLYLVDSCKACSHTSEDYVHFLLDCPYSKGLFRWFCDVWLATTDFCLDTSLTGVMFCSLPRKISKHLIHTQKILLICHGELLYTLWLTRCRRVFNDETLPLVVVTSIFKYRAKRSLDTFNANPRWCSQLTHTTSDELLSNMQKIIVY